jgi:hypothetical protein
VKNKIVFFISILISFIIFVFLSYSTIKYRSQSEDDKQVTILVQKTDFPPQQNFQRLLAKKKIDFYFTAKYNNLGTIAFLFNNYQKINSDWVWFRIKEKNSTDWYYQNKYNTDQFNPEYYFTFGFPVIANSQNKEYQIEIESISGTKNNSISLHSKSKNFLAKYSYSKSYLIQNPKQIFPFVVNKIKTYLKYIPKSDIYKIFLKSSIPLLLFLIIIFNPFKYFKYLKKIESNPKLNKIFAVFIPIFIFSATLIISGYYSTIGVDPHHDGIVLKPSMDVMSGQVLFKDTFTNYGALTTYIQAFSLKLFGPYLITIKLLTAFFYALISLLLYLIFKRFLPKLILFISLLIWLFMAPYYSLPFLSWSSVYALFFQLLATYLFILFFEKKSLKYLILASLFTNLVFWCRQPVGIFMFLAICVYFVFLLLTKQISFKLFDKYLSHFILINFLVSLFFILLFIFNHSLLDWFKQSLLFTFVWGESTTNGFSLLNVISCLFPVSISPLSIWILIPVSTILLLIVNYKNKYISFLTFIGLASWLQYYPINCIQHQYWAATPMIPLFCLFVYQLCQKFLLADIKIPKNIIKYMSILIIIFCFSSDIFYRLKFAYYKSNNNYQYVNEPIVLRGIKLNPDEAKYYQYMSEKITEYFAKNPQGNVVTNGSNALYLTFDSRIKNIQPMYVNWASLILPIYPNYWNILNQNLENKKPLLISFWNQIPPGYCRIDNLSNYDTASLSQPCP